MLWMSQKSLLKVIEVRKTSLSDRYRLLNEVFFIMNVSKTSFVHWSTTSFLSQDVQRDFFWFRLFLDSINRGKPIIVPPEKQRVFALPYQIDTSCPGLSHSTLWKWWLKKPGQELGFLSLIREDIWSLLALPL